MSIMDKLKKNSKIKETQVLNKSKFFNEKEFIKTDIPMVNVALSGSLDGGLSPGLTVLAGASKNFKTGFSLFMAASYLKKYEDAVILFYDSEFGSPQSYFNTFGIDTSRVLHTPIMNVEQLKFDLMSQLEEISEDDHVLIIIDSIGNLASKKEVDDALSEKSVADMTRAKALKGLFRMITPYLTMKNIPLLAINHVYKEIGLFPKDIVGGGCVVAGTKIKTNRGLVNIEEITSNDKVVTKDGYKNVTNIWNPKTLVEGTPECYEITFNDGFIVTVSDEHKFLVNDIWVEAKNLKENNKCETLDSFVSIIKIKKVGKKPVYDISVADVEHYVLENGVVTHNTGIYYAADNIWIIGRRQDKDGTDIKGYHFIINIEKSRYVKEKSKVPISISWEGGIQKYSGLLEIAVQGGFVHKGKKGRSIGYSHMNRETGEVEDKVYYERETMNEEFWSRYLENPEFKKYVEKLYKIGVE